MMIILRARCDTRIVFLNRTLAFIAPVKAYMYVRVSGRAGGRARACVRATSLDLSDVYEVRQ